MRPPAAGQIDHFDAGYPGLALRISYGGTRSWVYFYRWQGKQKRITLGPWPAVELAQAREAWREARNRLAKGLAPITKSDIAAGDIPHGDKQHAGRITGLEHRDDVRVVHNRRGLRLADEALPEFPVRGDGRGHDLQCHQPAELIVTRPEHHRHTAVADLLLQHVLADPGARAEVALLPWQAGGGSDLVL